MLQLLVFGIFNSFREVLLSVVCGAVILVAVFIFSKRLPQNTTKVNTNSTKKKELENKSTMSTTDSTEVFLTKKKQEVKLIKREQLSHDTRLFRFGLPKPDMKLGLPVGKHFKVYAPNVAGVEEGKWNGQEDKEAGKEVVERKYTPTSSDHDLGHFDLVIKVYKKGVVDRFPDGGKVSQYFESLAIGDSITIAGPFGLIEYLGKGKFKVGRKEFTKKQVGMIAGGTGITPMLQIITAIVRDKEDDTEVSLLFANQTEKDILVRDMLEKVAEQHPDKVKIWYTLDHPAEGWPYSQGFISEEMIQNHLPPPGDDTVVLMCGPPPMIKFACKPNLEKLGYQKDDQLLFYINDDLYKGYLL